MATTRQQTKKQIDSMVDKLKSIDMTAIEIGMLYQSSDSTVASTMYVITELVKVVIPLLEQTNNEL